MVSGSGQHYAGPFKSGPTCPTYFEINPERAKLARFNTSKKKETYETKLVQQKCLKQN